MEIGIHQQNELDIYTLDNYLLLFTYQCYKAVDHQTFCYQIHDYGIQKNTIRGMCIYVYYISDIGMVGDVGEILTFTDMGWRGWGQGKSEILH